MSFKTLFTKVIERILNTFSCCYPLLKTAQQRLHGKVLCFSLKGLSKSLVLIFNQNWIDVLNEWEGQVDCSITINMSLKQLKLWKKVWEGQSLATLIRSSKIEVKGDQKVVQNLIELAHQAEIELINFLSLFIRAISDGINIMFYDRSVFLNNMVQRYWNYIADILTEEWCIAPGSLETAWFKEEVAIVNQAVEVCEKRIKKLGEK